MPIFRFLRRLGRRGFAGPLPLLVLALGCHPTSDPARQRPAPSSEPDVATPTMRGGKLLAEDPIAFLEACLQKYDEQHIQGYQLIMEKQERIGGELGPVEVIDVSFRAHPYSVLMKWLSGARDAQSALYVQGENDEQMLVHPTGLTGKLVRVVPLDPDGAQAHRETRYSIKEFGLKKVMQRTLDGWKEAQANGTLHVEFRGVRNVPEVDKRPCYELRQSQVADDSGATEVTIYIDRATSFQVGTYLTGNEQMLIANYLYRAIQLNPVFPADRFTAGALAE